MDYLQRAKSFKTKKRLGQNFLIDKNTINTIIEHAQISKEDTVIEIGAGMGFVTEQLVKHAKKVIAIELDEDAIKELKKIPCHNLEIVHQDILKANLSDFTNEKIKIVANIPYYITSPIIAHLLGEIDDLNNKNRNKITDIILMVQYEVAQRIIATEKSPSKQYGLLSILSQFWADCEIIKHVPRKCFYPSPKVDSALVKLVVNDKPRLELTDYKHFRKVIKSAFSQRRKNIKNCLLSGGFSKENIQKTLEKLKIPENIRGETISIEMFGNLSEGLMREIKVKCPAKVNLTLEILNKRKDGFHNIQSVMQTIDLFDILTIKVEKNDKFQIKLSGTSNEIPYDERNLVYKAAELFMNALESSPLVGERLGETDMPLNCYTISIFIEKNIPVAAGLAGGSTDAAGTLWGLNKLFNNILSDKDLHELCAKLGSDLNFCLEGGCRLATGRGEILEGVNEINGVNIQEFSLSLIKPKNLGISAKEAYTKFAQLETKPNLDMTTKLVNALKSGNVNLQDFLHNDLEIALINNYKELKDIKSAYPASLMSGSGSTFFVLKNEIEPINDNFWIKTGLKSIPYGVSVV